MSRFDKVIILAFVLALITAIVGLLGVVPGFVFTNTEYAPGYSETGFDSVRIGDSEEKLLQTLGEPLERLDQPTGYSFLEYSERGWTLWYNERTIILSNSMVIRKFKVLNFL